MANMIHGLVYRAKRVLRRFVPRPLKRFYVRVCARSILHAPSSPTDSTPRLTFADILPPEGKFVRGGKVKLTHLRRRFGQYTDGFNILYLVSSTLPPYADIWVDEAHRAGVKVVWNQNGVGYPAWTADWERHNRAMLPIRDSDAVVYQSAACKEGADLWVSPSGAPSEIIPNCVDTEVFAPAPQPLPSRPLRLLVMGTHMTPEKVLIPLEALALLVAEGFDATLSIIGPCEFPGAEQLISRAVTGHGLESRVHRAGRYLQEAAPDLYRKHHIFVHMKYMDPCPNAVIEALACGLPVVGSASGGMPELVHSTSGILLSVPHDWEHLHYPSAHAVADAVRTIGGDWHAWSAAARADAVARFDVEDWLNAHERIFTRTLASR